MSHTKGPWSASGLGIYAHDASTGGDVMVANCDDVDKRPQGEAEANARLIAAAPDLLTALKTVEWIAGICMACGRTVEEGHNRVCRIGESLAKAEGKS